MAYDGLVGVARTFNKYLNPIASAVEIATGKSTESDYTEDKPRSESAMELGMFLLPTAKVGGTVLKMGGKVVGELAAEMGFKTLAELGLRDGMQVSL